MRPSRRNGAFALLLTLVVLAMAGVLLAQAAVRSLTMAVAADQTLEELQRRWGNAGLCQVILNHAEQLLDEAQRGLDADGLPSEKHRNPPSSELRPSIALAGRNCQLVLTDETAKWNVNKAWKGNNRQDVEAAIRRLTTPSSLRAATATGLDQLILRPLVLSALLPRTGGGWLPLSGYGQLYPGAAPWQWVGSTPDGGLASQITLWGDGRVNFRRASQPVLEETLAPILGAQALNAFLAARRHDPWQPLAALLGKVQPLDEDHRKAAMKLLTEQSNCHGLWIIWTGPQRSWYSLAVALDEAPETSLGASAGPVLAAGAAPGVSDRNARPARPGAAMRTWSQEW